MISQKIRKSFLDYFKNQDHTIVPSSSVIPHDDPTLLFINAGMNQFKDVFLGKSKRGYKRATSSQKCIRVGGKHNDLDNVGHTTRHLTFFEMLGNFSFGDYFKKEAISFAWDMTLNIFEFPKEKIWITVFERDDEAFEFWKEHVPENRIIHMGKKENFWAMGDVGPCGPCSELMFDRGEKYGDAPSPKEDILGERYLEFWNLVFMQNNRDKNGKMHPIPHQSVDTGAGLERLVCLKMDVNNVFQTDIFKHIIGKLEQVSGHKYDPNDEKLSSAFHVIIDHLRSLSFAISDGAQPSNIERGYILRKLLRRAVRYGRTFLEFEEPFLAKLFPSLIEVMGDDFRELKMSEGRIQEILTLEEESFIHTLRRGGNILSQVVEKSLASPHKQISGDAAFKLKDTYGFPLEEILLIAKDAGLDVNINAYQLLEEKAKERSRGARVIAKQESEQNLYANFASKHALCEFLGYNETKVATEIIGIIKNGKFVKSIHKDGQALLILKKTPFYAEKGGQVADIGLITNEQVHFQVVDCQTPYPGVIIHRGFLEEGFLNVGDNVIASIDEKKRLDISRHHTATHLLNFALQKVLGEHVKQAGSLVESNRLRFDIKHHKPVSEKEIEEIEDLINKKIRENQSVDTYELPFETVQSNPEIKQFGGKYGKYVRVVDISYSKELCGGTHVLHLGMIGYFRIFEEGSIAAGVRRIKACCGSAAENFVRSEEARIKEAAILLKSGPSNFVETLDQLLIENEKLKQKIQSLKKIQMQQFAFDLAQKVEIIKNIQVVLQTVSVELEDLQLLCEESLKVLKSGIVVLAITLIKRVQLVIAISPDLVKAGISAKDLIKAASSHIAGGGGGRPGFAQAGGKNPEGLDAALETIKQQLS